MTTKKIVIIVVSIVLAIGLIVVVFAGGIIGIVFYLNPYQNRIFLPKLTLKVAA